MASVSKPEAARADTIRDRLGVILGSPGWERFIMIVIIVNAIMLGLETSTGVMNTAGGFLMALDTVILTLFAAEIIARIYVYRGAFWRDAWSVFDFVVVAISLIPASGNLSVLRALRIIRAFRLISAVPSMRRVVGGLVGAIPGMGAVIALMLLILYVFSVMATKLYGETAPDLFGTLGTSAFSLFVVMTLEGWAEMANRVMEKHPSAWLFFLVYILITSFAVLNLFIGIIVDAMQQEQEAEMRADRERNSASLETVLAEVRQVKQELTALRKSMDAPPKKPGGSR